jgi:hypothetical protein
MDLLSMRPARTEAEQKFDNLAWERDITKFPNPPYPPIKPLSGCHSAEYLVSGKMAKVEFSAYRHSFTSPEPAAIVR